MYLAMKDDWEKNAIKKGPNDLEQIIADQKEEISNLQYQVGALQTELFEVKRDNKLLVEQIEDQLKQFRNKGAL
jgi:hypothetical protein